MNLKRLLLAALPSLISADQVSKLAFSDDGTIRQWLYASELDERSLALLDRPDIEGIQVIYRWRVLEPERDTYDFSQIYTDLEAVQSKQGKKKLWIQLQDRTFGPRIQAVPAYLKTEDSNSTVPQCAGDDGCDGDAEVAGWVAAQWNPRVRERFQALVKKSLMARSTSGPLSGNFNPQTYFDATLDNAKYAAEAFKTTYVVQYVNFWPNGTSNANNYLSDSFQFLAKNGIGIGGPDNLPYRPFQVANSYPYLWEYRNKVPISVIAIQEPDLSATSPNTSLPYTKDEFLDYAINHLGSKILFWATSAPWL
ncbi:uncharacterized protein MAM_04471 [Metarhizium album ARSEF 1941]|uniref:Uncharacterized protein n=1 Tax=Metarhizium album (strain ARSEF 1941) TaxID=1081103 RepID=A0A0B2WN12_METAS|nr:uncharacterized protein MAM_04471 [Metarhizium album ARSEF 1941]KHN97456.1 hypothetical protein MAM_04471 [Metarhizium album ARSEF 1941]